MNRRELIQRIGVVGLVGKIPFTLSALHVAVPQDAASNASLASPSPLKPPAHGSIPVALVISAGAVVIDFCGPWEVFESVDVPGRDENPFQLYTVSGTPGVVRASGGLNITPNYTFKQPLLLRQACCHGSQMGEHSHEF